MSENNFMDNKNFDFYKKTNLKIENHELENQQIDNSKISFYNNYGAISKSKEILSFSSEVEIEYLARELLQNSKFDSENIKIQTKNLFCSILLYILAIEQEKTFGKAKEIVNFNLNAFDNSVKECLFSKLIDTLEDVKPNHPAVKYYKSIKYLSIDDLHKCFYILKLALDNI